MKWLKTAIIASLLLTNVTFGETPTITEVNTETPVQINFENGNFFAVTTSFNQRLLDDFTEKVLGHEDKNLYIYFDSPGGSVIALSKMARIMKNSNINFTCVASFAASAAFMLFEHCNKRLLLTDGVLMSHNWSGGFRDEYPRMLTLMNAIQSLVSVLEEEVINKLNVNEVEYRNLINKNLWMPLPLARKYDAIDGTANVTCTRSLIKKRVRAVFSQRTMFGSSSRVVYKSGCPLIQKTYSKQQGRYGDDFVENSETLFDLAQKSYVLKQANWIYLGEKRK